VQQQQQQEEEEEEEAAFGFTLQLWQREIWPKREREISSNPLTNQTQSAMWRKCIINRTPYFPTHPRFRLYFSLPQLQCEKSLFRLASFSSQQK
jgi:hypothetical protein